MPGNLTDKIIEKLTPYYVNLLKGWSASVARSKCGLTEKQHKEFLSRSAEAKAAHDQYINRVMHRKKGV